MARVWWETVRLIHQGLSGAVSFQSVASSPRRRHTWFSSSSGISTLSLSSQSFIKLDGPDFSLVCEVDVEPV